MRLPRDDVVWAICPRRLLTFGSQGVSESQAELASKVFALAGFEPDEEISVWAEVSLSEVGADGGRFNYRLDYVLRSAKPGAAPIVVEVMTCSTSGGNRATGTDIQGASRRAVLFAHTPVVDPVEAPGVNVRQVWARMASQMIAKSEAANSWGGRTIWVVQDRLVEYIRTNTALPLDALHSPDWTPGEVNMLVSNLTEPVALYAGPIRAAHGDRARAGWNCSVLRTSQRSAASPANWRTRRRWLLSACQDVRCECDVDVSATRARPTRSGIAGSRSVGGARSVRRQGWQQRCRWRRVLVVAFEPTDF